MLPWALVRRRPALLLARAWLHYLRYQLQAIPPLLAAAEDLLANPTGRTTPRRRSRCAGRSPR